MVKVDIDHSAIERRKQLLRDLWDYRPIDHIPVFVWLNHMFGRTYHDCFESLDVHFEISVARIRKSLALLPDDYIPFARLVRGPMTMATMFGAGIAWTDDPQEAPGCDQPVIADLEQVYALSRPSVNDGIMGEHLRRLRYHAANLPEDVYLTGVFAGSPLQAAADLVETNAFYAGFHDNPRAMHHLLDLLTELQIEVFQATAAAAGGLERLTTLDFNPVWAPEAYKCILSDDISVPVGPRIFREFSLPYNSRIFQRWGSGMLHVCGPQVARNCYLDHTPKLKGLNCAYHWTRGDLPELRHLFAAWGVLQVNFDMVGERAEEMIAGYRHVAECLAPDVVAIPVCTVDDGWSDADITALYWEMRKISEEYASNMRWRTQPGTTRS